MFSIACALFHFPYPPSPLLATLTKTAGCVPTIPNLELLTSLPRAKPRGYSFTQSEVCEGAPYSSSFFSDSCTLFCAFLHSPETQPFYFQPIPHSLRKTPGGERVTLVRLTKSFPLRCFLLPAATLACPPWRAAKSAGSCLWEDRSRRTLNPNSPRVSAVIRRTACRPLSGRTE